MFQTMIFVGSFPIFEATFATNCVRYSPPVSDFANVFTQAFVKYDVSYLS